MLFVIQTILVVFLVIAWSIILGSLIFHIVTDFDDENDDENDQLL